MTTSSVDKSVSSQKALQEEEEVKSKLQSAEQQQVSWQHWGPISRVLSICILFIFDLNILQSVNSCGLYPHNSSSLSWNLYFKYLLFCNFFCTLKYQVSIKFYTQMSYSDNP